MQREGRKKGEKATITIFQECQACGLRSAVGRGMSSPRSLLARITPQPANVITRKRDEPQKTDTSNKDEKSLVQHDILTSMRYKKKVRVYPEQQKSTPKKYVPHRECGIERTNLPRNIRFMVLGQRLGDEGAAPPPLMFSPFSRDDAPPSKGRARVSDVGEHELGATDAD